jgi:two-component system, cell cycle sensor histidine kinase and response regulator CckA
MQADFSARPTPPVGPSRLREARTFAWLRIAGVAVLFTAAAVLVHVTLAALAGTEALYLPFGLAVLFASWHGGRAGGGVSAVLSAAAAAFVFLDAAPAARVLWFAAFLLAGLITTWAVTTMRRSARDPAAGSPPVRASPALNARADTVRLRLLLDSLRGQAIFMLDPFGYVVTWSTGAEQAFGYVEAEILGQHHSILQPEEDQRTGQADQVHASAQTHGHHDDEGWRVRRDGTRFRASVSVTAVVEDGELRGFAHVVRDATPRRTPDALLKSVLDSAIDGIIGIDERGMIRSFNAAAEGMFQYGADEVIGAPVGMLMPEPHRTRYTEILSRYLGSGDHRPLRRPRQLAGLRRDGTTFPLELAVSEFTLDGHRYLTAVVRDVTEQRTLEEQLQQAQKMQAVGQLAGGIAHDFNNVLTIISGHTELLLSQFQDGALHDAIAEVRDAAERAADLTRQLLAFSRRAVLDPKVVDLNSVVIDADKMLRRVIGEDIELVTHLAPDLRRVNVDRGQIGQVLVNLCVNARDAMPNGGQLKIGTRNLEITSGTDRLRAGSYVELTVRDTGCGMSPDVAARIFEPFYTTKQAGEGTGLGLSVVYGILKQSGGSVDVQTEPGVGTEFRITLPASHESHRVVPDAAAPEYAASGDETILMVEDEESVRRLAVLALRSHGYTVLEASNGSEALRILAEQSNAVDIVVTDIVMPVMGGRQLVEALRSTDPEVPVLYVSGYTNDAVVRHGVQRADVAFLQKPYTPTALAAKVRQVLDGPR